MTGAGAPDWSLAYKTIVDLNTHTQTNKHSIRNGGLITPHTANMHLRKSVTHVDIKSRVVAKYSEFRKK